MSREPSDQKSYFIAIIPPSPIYEQAQELKIHFRDEYKSKASLNSPPHITLHMPFKWKEPKEEILVKKLIAFAEIYKPFSLRLKNFSCFSPKVIFIDVETNMALHNFQKELHRFCKKELNLFNADYREQPFYPHLTLAFRDLKKPIFGKAWEEFKEKEFHAEFAVDKIVLLKHTGKVWLPHHEFQLGK